MKWVRNKRKFCLGLGGLILFSVILGLWLRPWATHRSGLEWADHRFNRLAKGSTYFIPGAFELARKFEGTTVDFGVHSRWPGTDELMARVIQANGFAASLLEDGRVRVRGDLGRLGLAASADADLLFKGCEGRLKEKYGVEGKEAIYYWWATFDGLTRRYIQENRTPEADFTRLMTGQVLEPAYNFAGIEAGSYGESFGSVLFLLGSYLLYTLLYGFSILYVFEGLGIEAVRPKEKKEA
jgi:hypothetical protein